MVNRWMRVFAVLLFFYIAAFFTSMAVMEMASWTLFALTWLAAWQARRRGQSPPVRYFRQGWDYLYLALIVVVSVGFFLNVHLGISPRIVFGGIRWIATLYMMSALILAFDFSGERLLRPYLWSLIIAGLYGLLSWWAGFDFVRHRVNHFFTEGEQLRAFSFLGFPMTWGHTSAIAFTFLFAFCLMRPPMSALYRRWLWLATGLTGANLILTFTRGAWLGAIAGIGVVSFLYGRFWFRRISIALLASGVLLSVLHPGFRARWQALTDAQNVSMQSRVLLWQANWQMFKENPWFGVGLNENETLVDAYHEKLGHAGAFHGHAHNNLLQFLSSTGILGFTLFVALFVLYVIAGLKLWRAIPTQQIWDRTWLLASLGAQMTLHVGGLTECNFKAMSVNHHFVFQVAIILALCDKYGVEPSRAA